MQTNTVIYSGLVTKLLFALLHSPRLVVVIVVAWTLVVGGFVDGVGVAIEGITDTSTSKKLRNQMVDDWNSKVLFGVLWLELNVEEQLLGIVQSRTTYVKLDDFVVKRLFESEKNLLEVKTPFEVRKEVYEM
ncbi:hypothetical protein Tco_0726541 [Tanacetum coccineum]|uniref:Uncharacterized protein n=1 Tax=Tanacetum coccineum TaxID=301880 RepID=A0ABQ4YI67_9ASTR